MSLSKKCSLTGPALLHLVNDIELHLEGDFMKRRLIGVSVAVGVVAGAVAWASTASAALIEIATSEDGGALTLQASGVGTASFAGVVGDYVVDIDGTGDPVVAPPLELISNNFNVSASGGVHTLDVYVTSSGNTNPT